MKKLDTILFDLDGTLINTNELIIRSFASTFAKHFPKVTVTREDILTFIGPTLQQTFKKYTEDVFEIQDMIKSYREFYVAYEPGSFEIYPEVEEVIKELFDSGYNLGIVTSKYTVAAWPSFTHYNLEKYFKAFIGLENVTYPKPHQEPVLLALSKFDSYNKAIMIGDNQGDILSAKNAGIYSAGVAWSIKGSHYLMQVNPDFMLSSMKDIFRVIKLIEEE
ncbi:MAG: pyrophosphatase PpaX [Candidatus Izemoplasma sp.]